MATQVPYTGTTDVSPQLAPTQNVHVDTPTAAFGGAVAGAISHLGDVAEGAGKELLARANAFQEMNEQVKADSASADTSDAQTQRYLQFDQLKGQDRVDGLPQYISDIKKLREQGGQDLTSPYAKMKYLDDSRRNESAMVWHGGILARQGQDEATQGTLRANMNATVNQFATVNPNDDKGYHDAVDKLRQTADEYSHFNPQIDPASALSGQVSKLLKARSDADPVAGKQLYERAVADKLLTPEDADALHERIENAVTLKLGRKIGHDVGGSPDNQTSNPKVIEDKARAAAEKADPGNKDLSDTAADMAVARLGHEQEVQRAAWRETQSTLIQGIDGSSTNGKVPVSLEEAIQDPKIRDAYLTAPADVQGAVREQIRKNQTTDGYIPNEEGNKAFNNLYTALKDPRASASEVDEALNSDLLKTSMTREQRKTIMDLQSKTLKDQSSQSNVNSAMNIAEVQKAITDAGLQKNTDQYNQFVQQFTEAIGDYATGAHRTVKDHKQLGEIAQSMTYQMTTQHLGGYWNTKSGSTYENILESKPELKAQAIKAWTKINGSEPTPEQLESMAPAYYQKFFTELGQKSRPEQPKLTNRVVPTQPKAPAP